MGAITYIDESGVKSVKIDLKSMQRLPGIGRARFDTTFVRNMFFITNVVRILRLKLSRELTHSRSVIASSHMALSAELTEYGTDPFGANEVFNSKTNDGLSRYDDMDDFVR
jgi:hypothetical protein